MALHPFSVILLIVLVKNTFQASNFMSVCQNKKYVNSGTVSINTASAASWNPYSVNVTYPFSFSSPVLGVFLTISGLNVNTSTGLNISFYGVVNSFGQTSFMLNVYSNTSSNLITLGYRYMAFALNDQKTFGWILASVTQPINSSTLNNSCTSVNVTVPLGGSYTLSFSQLNQYAISFLGYGAVFTSSTYQNQFYISLYEGNYTNVNSLTAKVAGCTDNFVSFSPNSTINGAYFNVLIFNKSSDPTLPYIKSSYYSFGSADYVNSTYIYYINSGNYLPSTLLSTNQTLIYNGLQFNINVSDYFGNISSTSKYLAYGYFTSFYTYYCPYLTPYLLDSTCYDTCPNQTSSNSTQLTCSAISTPNPVSPGLQAGSVFGYISFFLVLIVIIAVIYLYRNREDLQQNQATARVLNSSNQPQNIEATRYQVGMIHQNIHLDSQAVIPGQKEQRVTSISQCSLCQKEQTNFRTDCGHSFHAKCIVTWSENNDKCPNCQAENLTKKSHRVLCRFCKQKDKWLNFSELRQKYVGGTHSEEFICNSCISLD